MMMTIEVLKAKNLSKVWAEKINSMIMNSTKIIDNIKITINLKIKKETIIIKSKTNKIIWIKIIIKIMIVFKGYLNLL